MQGNISFKPPNQGAESGRAASAAGFQGTGSHERGVLLADTAMLRVFIHPYGWFL